MSNILQILHPFIPFFTEKVWRSNNYDKINKSSLVLSHWIKKDISLMKFKTSSKNIEDIIEIISSIRSAKAELNIKPKLFCDIIFKDKSKIVRNLILKNTEIIKQMGRINEVSEKSKHDKSFEILVLKEKLSLKFDENVDILSQKSKLENKINILIKKIENLEKKLKNKAYTKNAPKEIVLADKISLKDLNIEVNKLRSIVESIN
tara:strand:+ start:48 stop:662 length:615 start_codon:yes stop_codon:yes gene_type:complete